MISARCGNRGKTCANIAFLALFIWFLVLFEAKNVELSAKLSQVEAKNEELSAKLSQGEAEKSKLNGEIGSLKVDRDAKVKDLNDEIAQLKAGLAAGSAESSSKIESLKDELEGLKKTGEKALKTSEAKRKEEKEKHDGVLESLNAQIHKLKPCITSVHIPKTGGTSLNNLLGTTKKWGGGKSCRWSMQACFIGETRQRFSTCQIIDPSLVTDMFEAFPNYYIVTVVREPVAHVKSQFLMCRDSKWGEQQRTADFPISSNEDDDYRRWLQHFIELDDSQVGAKVSEGSHSGSKKAY